MQLFTLTKTKDKTVEIDQELVKTIGIKYPVVMPFTAWERYIKKPNVDYIKTDEKFRALAILQGLYTTIKVFNSFNAHPFIVNLDVDFAFDTWPNEMHRSPITKRQVRFKSRLMNDHQRRKTVVIIEPHLI